ncbi:hypothetical protein LO80_03185 [Candidatus Francisella endociliophora]|uniref:Uncharacterized protein n=1 Tax=Candidatus Francisella endociliophora TaxID=653937 RepID=A0A097END1_9GAMM|nr:hypothetical protein [Francisella sp. FSC1006]AIT09073.1 hypothetical protein LO80_03185 [Francisella sp. FSC1006]
MELSAIQKVVERQKQGIWVDMFKKESPEYKDYGHLQFKVKYLPEKLRQDLNLLYADLVTTMSQALKISGGELNKKGDIKQPKQEKEVTDKDLDRFKTLAKRIATIEADIKQLVIDNDMVIDFKGFMQDGQPAQFTREALETIIEAFNYNFEPVLAVINNTKSFSEGILGKRSQSSKTG